MYGIDGDKVCRCCRLLHLRLSSLFQTAINFLWNGSYYHPHYIKFNLKYLLYLSSLSCFEELLVHSTVTSEHSEHSEQQSSSSPGTQSINRKYSLSHSVLFHSPPSPYHSITHPLSGSGFVSGVCVCVRVLLLHTDYQNLHSPSRVRTFWLWLWVRVRVRGGASLGLLGLGRVRSWGMNYGWSMDELRE